MCVGTDSFKLYQIVYFVVVFHQSPAKIHNYIKNRQAEIFSILVIPLTVKYLFTGLKIFRVAFLYLNA